MKILHELDKIFTGLKILLDLDCIFFLQQISYPLQFPRGYCPRGFYRVELQLGGGDFPKHG